ncbi:MAG: hypothetical protein JNK21_08410, partial [Rhodospirillaceae bacterium]|nr:hypothetical protein [Rhodospirillaceae bacterium]
MPNFIKKTLKAIGLSSAPPAKAKTAAPKQKGVLPPSEREALVKEAMTLYRANAGQMRGVIEGALKQLKDTPPNPNDLDALTRLLTVHRAYLDMRRLMNHRDRRYLVLAGLRELLEQKGPVAPSGVK